jgi:hypothetical protein
MTKLIIAIVLTLTSTFANAQLKGSGKTVTKTYDYQNFNKVNFDDLDGKLEIEVGKPFSISITIDDNLEKLLSVLEASAEKTLTVSLKGNRNNKMYIEDTKIKVKITMPFLMEVSNNGNSGLSVTTINAENFKSNNPVNGSTTLSGIVDNLEISCRGNGNLYAEKLSAKNAVVICRGNGNAKLNVSTSIIGTVSGNGNIINYGKANFDSRSTTTGNGSLNGKKK